MTSPGPKLSDLPDVNTYITGYNESGKAIVESTRPADWKPFFENSLGFNVAYTTSEFPASLADNTDVKAHDALLASGKLGLVNPRGTVCRHVDFAPNLESLMHRTQSLDYGIVIEGTIEMVLDSGEVTVMKRGDVAVQRATMHAWRNPSKTEWARMVFVLQDCQKIIVGGQVLTEDLGGAKEVVPSGNDTD